MTTTAIRQPRRTWLPTLTLLVAGGAAALSVVAITSDDVGTTTPARTPTPVAAPAQPRPRTDVPDYELMPPGWPATDSDASAKQRPGHEHDLGSRFLPTSGCRRAGPPPKRCVETPRLRPSTRTDTATRNAGRPAPPGRHRYGREGLRSPRLDAIRLAQECRDFLKSNGIDDLVTPRANDGTICGVEPRRRRRGGHSNEAQQHSHHRRCLDRSQPVGLQQLERRHSNTDVAQRSQRLVETRSIRYGINHRVLGGIGIVRPGIDAPSTISPTTTDGLRGCVPRCVSGFANPGPLPEGPFTTEYFLDGRLTLVLEPGWVSTEDQGVEFNASPTDAQYMHRAVLVRSRPRRRGRQRRPRRPEHGRRVRRLARHAPRARQRGAGRGNDRTGSAPAVVIDIQSPPTALNEDGEACPTDACMLPFTWPNAGGNIYGFARPGILRLYVTDVDTAASSTPHRGHRSQRPGGPRSVPPSSRTAHRHRRRSPGTSRSMNLHAQHAPSGYRQHAS